MIIVVFASYDEKITGSGLTIFNGAYPVHYECHDSAVYSNGLNYSKCYLESWIAESDKNRSCM